MQRHTEHPMGVAGGVFPLSFGIARDALPTERVSGALSALSAVIGVGAGIGLPLSGVVVVVDQLSVPWLFWIALLAVAQGARWGWSSVLTLGAAATGVLLLVAWVRFEGRVASPLVALGTLRRRAVLAADLSGFISGFSLFAGFLLIPQLAQTPPPSGSAPPPPSRGCCCYPARWRS